MYEVLLLHITLVYYFEIPNYMEPLGAPKQAYISYKRLNSSDEASGISFASQIVWNWGGPLCHCSHDYISAGTEESSLPLLLPQKMKMVKVYFTAVQSAIMTANSETVQRLPCWVQEPWEWPPLIRFIYNDKR